jgi:zinc protease
MAHLFSRPASQTRIGPVAVVLTLLAAASATPFALRTAHAATPSATPAHETMRPVTIAVQKNRLANGLEVITHEDHRTPIVSVNLWYHVGSKDEPAGKNGFAHLFEHVMFQGSKHVPEDTYFLDLERAGGTSINGSTSTDRTNYFETVPSNRLELALWLESDRMGFLLDHVDQATFTGQRDVVKNERRQRFENAPYGWTEQFVCQELYPKDHPYHLLTIGTPEDLDAATLDDVKAFFRTWYVPNNATLVISGDIDPAAALALADKYFGAIPAGVVPDRKKADNPPPVHLRATKVLDIAVGADLPRVVMAWPTPPSFKSGDAELDLVANVLTGGKTSRLYKRLVYDMQIAESVMAYQDSAELGSKFVIMATAQPNHTTDELRAAIDDELHRLSTGGVTDEELVRGKANMLSGIVFSLESDSERANRINMYNQVAGDPAFLPKDMDRYASATVASVSDAARRYLPLDGRVIAVLTPDKTAPVAGVLRSVKELPTNTVAPAAVPTPAVTGGAR